MRSRRFGPVLRKVAEEYQRDVVGPHCRSCLAPCCRLETLVLELDWDRLKSLWGVAGPRREFDDLLNRGQGPAEIRRQDGLYYAYRRVCPAFDEGRRLCRVYEGSLKPPGCTDFPVYEESQGLTADLRCEAVDSDDLAARVQRAVRGAAVVSVRKNPRFPFLVSLSMSPPGRAARRRGPNGPEEPPL